MTTTKTLFLLAMVAAAECRPTHCERWKGDTEFRCGKDNYQSDTVWVRNRTGSRVSFKVGKWLSRCGRPGQNYSDQTYNLSPSKGVNIDFGEVGPGSCNEMYIHDCKINNSRADCLDTVTVTPNF